MGTNRSKSHLNFISMCKKFNDKIFIEDLRISCIVGILPKERVSKQDLLVTLEITCDLEKSAISGDVCDTVDYFALANEVKDYCVKRKAGLLEELGHELCAMIFNKYSVSHIKIRLSKPDAVAEAGACGIEMNRAR